MYTTFHLRPQLIHVVIKAQFYQRETFGSPNWVVCLCYVFLKTLKFTNVDFPLVGVKIKRMLINCVNQEYACESKMKTTPTILLSHETHL